MGLPDEGRRRRLGAIAGARDEANVNGTSSALLVALGCNSDIQLPYRVAIDIETHSTMCGDKRRLLFTEENITLQAVPS